MKINLMLPHAVVVWWAGFANSSFELLAGIGVFSILGFMAASQGVGVDEVVSAGVGLAFVVFPQIINELPLKSASLGLSKCDMIQVHQPKSYHHVR